MDKYNLRKVEISFFFFKEINTFIQQGCINLSKSDSKDVYVYIKPPESKLFQPIWGQGSGVCVGVCLYVSVMQGDSAYLIYTHTHTHTGWL